jgi:MFS superfamily sulfate permease-like transporter
MNSFNLQCILMGLCGTILSTLAVTYSLSKKAKAANVIFNIKDYLKTDWFAPVISFVAILMALIALPYIPAAWHNSPGIIILIFATIGYSGNDLVSRFFSVVNQRINGAIDYKTTMADTQTGTLDKPTPAAPIVKTDSSPKI